MCLAQGHNKATVTIGGVLLRYFQSESVSQLRFLIFNPFMPNVITHPYQLDGTFLNVRVVG